MRQVQITTEAGVAIILMVFIFSIIVIAVQQNKFTKNIDEITTSMKATQMAVDEAD